MRKLKIVTKDAKLFLENTPSEYSFIEAIAQQYAHSVEDLNTFYSVGVLAVENLKANNSIDYFEKKVAWIVRQTILQEKNKKIKLTLLSIKK